MQSKGVTVSLWRALWTGFGWPYISLGILKFFSDALNFAGELACTPGPIEKICAPTTESLSGEPMALQL
jgi:hypothetical protein